MRKKLAGQAHSAEKRISKRNDSHIELTGHEEKQPRGEHEEIRERILGIDMRTKVGGPW